VFASTAVTQGGFEGVAGSSRPPDVKLERLARKLDALLLIDKFQRSAGHVLFLRHDNAGASGILGEG
jgi:hypothetical protein